MNSCECNPPEPVRYGNTDSVYCKKCGEILKGIYSDWVNEDNDEIEDVNDYTF